MLNIIRSLTTIVCVFGGIKINWHGGKGRDSHDFLESCKSFQTCLVLFRVLTNNYNSRLQLSCGVVGLLLALVFFFWTDLASIIFDGGLHIHIGEGTRSYYLREATFLSLC